MKKTISPAVVIAVVVVVVIVAVYLFARGARTQQVSTAMGPAEKPGAQATGLAGSRMKPGAGRARRGGRGRGGRAGR
jgi:hypothetical protein